MPIRLKFKVVSLADAGGGTGKTVNLAPVMEAPENQQHYRAQSGHMFTIGTLHNASAESFVTGQEYWMDFTPVNGAKPEQPKDQQAEAAKQRDAQAARQRTQDEEEAIASRSAREATAAKHAAKVETASHSTHKAASHSKHAPLTHEKSKTTVRR